MNFLNRQNYGIIFVTLIFCVELSCSKSIAKQYEMTNTELTQAAGELLKMMDQSVDPCGNFYSFTCGGLLTDKMTRYNIEISRVRDRYNYMERDIQFILESKTNLTENAMFSTARKIYKTCKDLDITDSEKENIISTIAEEVGLSGYDPENIESESDYDDDDEFDWIDVIHKFREVGLNFRFPFGVYVTPRSETDKRNILEIRRPILSEDYELGDAEDPFRKSYPIWNKIKERSVILTAEDFFEAASEYFPMQRYIEGLLPEDIDFSLKDEIRVDLSYFAFALTILKDLKPSEMAQLLYSKLTAEISNLLPTEYTTEEKKKQKCKENTIQYDFNFQVAIAKHYFSQQHKDLAEELVSNVLRHAKMLVNDTDNFDKQSKLYTLEKMESLQVMIGHSNNTIPTPSLDWDDFDAETFVRNLLELSRYQADAKFGQLNLVKDVREWDFRMPPSHRNAAYYRNANSVYFPAIYMYSKMFDSIDLPKYLQYGTIGITMGHEIGHVIHRAILQASDMIKESDNEINLAIQKMEEFDDCLARTFDKYDMGYDKTKRNEDIADLLGFKTAYNSYLEFLEDNGEEEQLPGLDYNSRQMFWIATASSYCSNHAFDHRDTWHSPKSIRVLMPFSNLPEFARDFNCPLGSEMNREDKCELL